MHSRLTDIAIQPFHTEKFKHVFGALLVWQPFQKYPSMESSVTAQARLGYTPLGFPILFPSMCTLITKGRGHVAL